MNQDTLTRHGEEYRRYQVFRELLIWGKAHSGSVPTKSDWHRLVYAKYKMSWTQFRRHFDALKDEGLITYDVDPATNICVIVVLNSDWTPPDGFDL